MRIISKRYNRPFQGYDKSQNPEEDHFQPLNARENTIEKIDEDELKYMDSHLIFSNVGGI